MSRRKQVFSVAASSGDKGGVSRVFTWPACGALVITASAVMPGAEDAIGRREELDLPFLLVIDFSQPRGLRELAAPDRGHTPSVVCSRRVMKVLISTIAHGWPRLSEGGYPTPPLISLPDRNDRRSNRPTEVALHQLSHVVRIARLADMIGFRKEMSI